MYSTQELVCETKSLEGRFVLSRVSSFLVFMALAICSLLFDSSSAYALSASCTTLNGLSGSGTFSRSFAAGSFAAGESVSVTFSDNGSNVGNSNPSSADNVILRNPTNFSPYFDYRSNTGSSGSHTGTASAADLTKGLFISIKVGTYLSPVTISCGAAVSSDATLSNLIPSAGTLSPSFSSGTSTYTVAVASNVSSITFTPTASDSNATITVNGMNVGSGATSPAISLNTGPNTISVMGTAQDGSSTHLYTITVTRALAAPDASNVTAAVAANSSGNPITLALSGATATSVAVASGPSHGVASASGTSITYTPAAGYSGTDSFTYTASNTAGSSSAATVSITVTQPTLAVTPGFLPAGQIGTAYSQSLSAAGGTAPYSYASSGALPTGLNLDLASGIVSGTPTSVGGFNFTITATDSHGATGSTGYSVSIVAGALPVTGTVSATVAANTSTPVNLALSGGVASSVAVASAPLHGSAFASGTTITYTPVTGYSGPDSFTYTASNLSGTSSPATVTLTVTAPTLVLTPAAGALPAGQAGTAYSQSFSSTGGSAPFSYTSSGVPAGLTLDAASGVLSGTPASPGSYNLSVSVTDRNGAVGNANYTLNIAGGPVPVANPVSAVIAANSSGSIALSLAGGTATSVAVVTAPMHGSAVARGLTITYTPVAGFSGTDSFTYTASNVSGTSPAATVNLTISAPTLIVSPAAGSLPAATIGARYSQALSVSGGNSPYRFSATGLPSGLNIDTSSGTISGTPSEAGSATIAVQITDASGATLNVTYSLSIGGTLPSGADRSASLYAGQAVTVNLADGISGGPFTGAALVDTPTKAMGQTTLSGTSLTFVAAAQASGTVIIRYTLSNRWGASQPVTLTLQVAGRSDPSKDQEVIGMLGAQGQSAARFARAQIDNFNDRLEQLHDKENRRGSSFNLQLGLPQSHQSCAGNTSASEMYQALSSLSGSDRTASPQLSAAPGSNSGLLGDESLSFWSGGYVNVSDTRRDDVKLDSTMVGMSAGVDYRFFEAFTAGIGFGYGRDSSDIGSEGSHSKGDSFSGAIYGSFHPGRFFIDGLLGYSNLSFDSRRYVTDNGVYAKGSRDGDQFFGSLSSGYEFKEDAWRVAPYGRVDVSSTKLDGFRESGSGAFDLAYAAQRMNVLSGTGGLRGQYGFSLKPTELTLRGRLEYSHTFSGDSTARMGYADISDSTYGVSTQGQSENLMTVALGADLALPGGLTTGVTYQGSYGLGDDSRSHALMLRLGTRF
ncbi:autotransporter domain-containing protein [Pseudomonas lurida]|uniref:autotransporter domain-containing protein n=1 Tax=Pseudomonas lurida TaxID=244566 RepID=UPI0016569F51|nr:autotransporter domain-containing protein [Pseudomonas lurida]MBC8982357.1 autotransporter domain-containing protein [Pseudomonas lurida]